MPKYITCITRMLLNSHSRALRTTSCEGNELIQNTHCQYCEYWKDNLEDTEEED